MKPGPPTLYPQLNSFVWMNTFRFMGYDGIARLLGCVPEVAKKSLKEHGLWRNDRFRKPWTELETALFVRFFPRYKSKVLAIALGRKYDAIIRKGRHLSLQKVPCAQKGTDAEFWEAWQEHIMSPEFRKQIGRDNWVWYMDLTHSGAEQAEYVKCSKCEYRSTCDGAAKEPLPCMTTLVFDVMRGGAE